MAFFRIFELLVILGLLYLCFVLLKSDTKMIIKKTNETIKKGEK